MVKLLAKKYNIKVYWFYGVTGHRRGLVDPMSSFGVKQPLKHEIITNDNWFPTANGMVFFLKDCFETKGDDSKEYRHIDQEKTSKIRAKKHGEIILKLCRCCNFSKVLYFRNVDFCELSRGKSFDTISEDIFSDDL